MKRESRIRRLHMGCGEGLIGRTRAPSQRTATMPGGHAVKQVDPKTGKGKR